MDSRCQLLPKKMDFDLIVLDVLQILMCLIGTMSYYFQVRTKCREVSRLMKYTHLFHRCIIPDYHLEEKMSLSNKTEQFAFSQL